MDALLSTGGSIASAVLNNLVDQVSSDAIQQFGQHSGLEDDLSRLRMTLRRASFFTLDSADEDGNRWGKTPLSRLDSNLDQIRRELKDAAYDAEDLLGEFEYQYLHQKAENQENQGGNFLSTSLTPAKNLFNRDDAVARLREVMGKLSKFAVVMRSGIGRPDLDDAGKKYQRSVRLETKSRNVSGCEQLLYKPLEAMFVSGDHETKPSDDFVHVRPMGLEEDSVSFSPAVVNPDLPACLKQCVAYCSIFPKCHIYQKEEMVQMWTAQGFIAPQGNMRFEEVGSQYFHDLLGRSLFRHVLGNDYVMHDSKHDLVQCLSVDEYLRIEDGKWQKIPNRLRHLSIYNGNLELSKLIFFGNYKNLRTLVFKNLYDPDFCSMLHRLLTGLTKIRVLQLRNCWIKVLPESIGNLKHLRYLDVSSNNIRRLPESLCNLYNLQVLNISKCPIENFPARMTNLIKLRQLKADEKSICKLADISKLTSLQELPVFVVPKLRGRKIKELKGMIQLHGSLCIKNLENVESEEEASQAELNNKPYLDELALVWSIDSGTSSGNDGEVLEGLQPHSNLRMLKIRKYGGVRFPSWMEPRSLKNLKGIFLENIQSCQQLPSLGQLPLLEILHIKDMHAVRQVGHEFYGSPEVEVFPLLEELEISGMPEWKEWFREEGIQVFPRLLKLHIMNCPKLKGLPCLPPLVRELHLGNVGINILPESGNRDHDFNDDNKMLQRSRSSIWTSSISDIYIMGCPNLVNLEQWLLLHHLPDIKELRIINCQKVLRLPMQRFNDFSFLERLEIIDCPLTMSPVQLFLPSSLRHLALGSCGRLDESLSGCLHNLTSLTSLMLVRCPHITSLPGEVLRHMMALTRLTILECRELRSLGDLRALRSLQNLTVRGCPRLTVSANEEDQGEYSAPLCFLSIDDTAHVKVLFSTITLPSLETLEICNSTQLILFAGDEQLFLQGLKSLRSLVLTNCTNLQSLPSELHSLSTLQFLCISNCPEIRSLPGKGLPSSLTDLYFCECHPVLTEQLKRRKTMLRKSI